MRPRRGPLAPARARARVPEIFFTADTHFGHGAVAGLLGRRRADGARFASTTEMDEALVAAWNAAVGPRDTVWHLGDVARARTAGEVDRALALRSRLNGAAVFLVRGNLDGLLADDPRFAWAGVCTARLLRPRPGAPRLMLHHAPLAAWPGAARGVLHLHGHSHGRSRAAPGRLDVGIDAVGPWAGALRPVTLDEVLARVGPSYIGPSGTALAASGGKRRASKS